ncbi:hypothetical protein [Angustibacter sp. Root456]|uniref:hypothetical protein n=1 Tax=Angustibacter sp. Root456 TaxID=1736539 RepID=UPI0012F911F1|nr:hypothetical protein [Angustibacter sp. Root456]
MRLRSLSRGRPTPWLPTVGSLFCDDETVLSVFRRLASGELPHHQRRYARTYLDWLAARRGWGWGWGWG